LPTDHKYRKNKNDFFVGKVEMNVTLPVLLGEELYDMVLQYDDIVFSFQTSKQMFFGFGMTYN
jgi:hypothetical protein